jgi:hypothetical protein
MNKRSRRLAKMRVTADGDGVVSHAGTELLRELAGFTGLIDAWDKVLIGTYKGVPVHYPGSVLADLSVAIADGADSISDLKVLRDQPRLFGPVASKPTAWRVLDRVSAAYLFGLRRGRANARAAAWAASGARSHLRAVSRHRRHDRNGTFTWPWHRFVGRESAGAWTSAVFRRAMVFEVAPLLVS